MNKDQIKGKIEEIKGDVKQRIGGASKDRSTEAGGLIDEQKGKLRKGVGDVKEDLDRREDEEKNPSREEP